MAKKREENKEASLRRSRKEILLARKQARQTRQIRIAVLGIVGLLALVILVGVVNELIIKPDLPVAEVNGTEISMKEWQDRVEFQRAQLIISLDDLAEAFNQDIGQVQQYAGQQINLLEDPESLGQFVLDEMVDEILIQQAAEEKGIEVTEADVQEELETAFGYFGGDSPTPLPTATETPIPTPSLTPIVSEVITDTLATSVPEPTPTTGPTSTPFPTATPISLESFEESFEETMTQFGDLGSSQEIFRDVIRARLYRELLIDTLAIEEELPKEALQASYFFLRFDSEEEASQALEEIGASDYRTVWNTIRSKPVSEEDESTAIAREILWRSFENIETIYGFEMAETAFELELEQPSDIIEVAAEDEEVSTQYYILFVTGREIRPLSESEINGDKQEFFQLWLEEQKLTGVETFDRWRANVPHQPVLDRRFLLPPTPGPATAIPEVPELNLTPEIETGE
jgi:hypothetical protein